MPRTLEDGVSMLLKLIAFSELEYFLCYSVRDGPVGHSGFLFGMRADFKKSFGINVKLFMLLILALLIIGMISVNHTFLFLVCHHESTTQRWVPTDGANVRNVPSGFWDSQSNRMYQN
ncbi:hypothetical protein PIB30_022239 [Stylosanthes scabra]|uniref:Uncharacterized protein n=1 Tax=Stylosanthes scabra TaxID=79078 RepID=A0ABU6Q9R0_9FABA|nr:hypothetical protein [Stylosanthes scabra]